MFLTNVFCIFEQIIERQIKIMPTLHWIGKEKVVNHHQDVPFKVLEHKYGFDASSGKLNQETGTGNKIIHGDNLEALKSLLPQYEGRVKCIYIDPPYNTGNEKWVYNDNVNHPKIKKWLGEVVGKQGEDLSRHDKWLCMMYPRLVLLHKLLADEGAIFISIDDNEQANLKLICDEIFGGQNFVANIIWQKKTGAADAKGLATVTEYILVYCKNFEVVNEIFNRNEEAYDIKRYRYKDEYFNERGPFYYDTLDRGSIRYSDSLNYPIIAPDGTNIYPNGRTEFINDAWTWKWSEDKVIWGIENGFIDISKSKKSKNNWVVRYKIYLNVDNEGKPKNKSVPYKNLITNVLNADASAKMKQLFNSKVFEYAKPVELIEMFLKYINTSNDAIILDSFAGSGTTAHAVLNMNKQDGGNRKFILIEMEDYADSITAERVKRVMQGYGTGKNDTEGTGGSFDYYELGQPLFREDKNLNEEVGEEKIREYIFFSETKQYLDRKQTPEHKYLLDTYNDTAYYFYYEKESITTLSIETLNIVTEQAEQYLIYADHCLLDKEYMLAKNIIFKKIPRDIRRF